ncbi:MAG: sensor histidine kinase [Bosea sp. (in: a-proteobacteria)]
MELFGPTLSRFDPRQWPLAFKAPAVVVIFMMAISAVITHAVLNRLKETQERHLAALSTTYLEGLASAVLPYVLREDVWEVYDAIDRSASLGGGFGRAIVVITTPDLRVIAASHPAQWPLGTRHPSLAARFVAGRNLIVDEADGKAHGQKLLRHQGRDIGRIFADYEIAHLITERADVLRTLLLTNLFLALTLAGMAYWTIRRMLSPLALLSRHIGQTVAGPLLPVPLMHVGDPDSEFARLFRRYNSLIEAFGEREDLLRQLAEEERVASLGRLTSGMAHEINNPLGGLFNAIDTLKRHGEKASVRHSSVDLIERGLRGIRDVVKTALATYRADPEHRELVAVDLDDMRLLVRPELERKRVKLDWRNHIMGPLTIPSAAIRQILLNLLLNAVAAVPEDGQVTVFISVSADEMILTIEDNGPGLGAQAIDLVTGRSSRPVSTGEGTGLGLWMSQRLAAELKGHVTAGRSELGGAAITVRFPINHERSLSHAA